MKRIHAYCALFWMLFALFICIEAWRLKLGAINNPGPGFFPFSAGLVMLGLAAAGFLQSIGKPKQEKEERGSGRFKWWNIVIILGAILAYTLILETVGFLLDTFFFIFLLLKTIEPQSWKTAALTGAITAVVADVVFRVIFMANLPVGFTGF